MKDISQAKNIFPSSRLQPQSQRNPSVNSTVFLSGHFFLPMLCCVFKCIIRNVALNAPHMSDRGTEPSLDLCQNLPLQETLPHLPPSPSTVCGFPGQPQVPKHSLLKVRYKSRKCFYDWTKIGSFFHCIFLLSVVKEVLSFLP